MLKHENIFADNALKIVMQKLNGTMQLLKNKLKFA